ncbi:Glutathione S-transferase T3 [Glycine max]|nr:Glutathione S-transferase T3 [Glycine max]
MSNTQIPCTTFPTILANSHTKVSIDDVGSQFPQFSTQIGLDEIIIDEIGGSSAKKKPRVAFAVEEDTHLISSWLNISTDPIVGIGQGKEAFWLRNKFQGKLSERAINQLKSQRQKSNLGVQKFKCHYKQTISLKKSDCTENDEDEGTDFGLEHAWRLLKDQPKWLEQFTESCFKRTKISAYGAYSSSSNPETPVEADTPSPIIRRMGQKTVKRKSKGK